MNSLHRKSTTAAHELDWGAARLPRGEGEEYASMVKSLLPAVTTW